MGEGGHVLAIDRSPRAIAQAKTACAAERAELDKEIARVEALLAR